MARPLLLIVTGRPATGKTALARRLSRDLALPLIYKDGVKESLYDSLGAPDRAASRRLGAASLRLQRAIAEELLDVGVSVILEANFREDYDGPHLRALIAKYGTLVGQVWLTADPATLIARFERRAGGPERHPGHMELANMEEFRQALMEPGDAPLSLPGPLLAMDTTEFNGTAYLGALAFCRQVVDGANSGRHSL
jgi:predicted kinase